MVPLTDTPPPRFGWVVAPDSMWRSDCGQRTDSSAFTPGASRFPGVRCTGLPGVAMLDGPASDLHVSTGLDALDAALGGLFWGDNVVWHVDGVSPELFYRAIARLGDAFESKTSVAIAGT